MSNVAKIIEWMEQIAPPGLSESWDNTGLLIGDRKSSVSRVQTCLTLTPDSVEEAINEKADLVIAHHPLPFKPVASINTDTVTGRMIWDLAKHGVSVYVPHTAWDSAEHGINSLLAERLQLNGVVPMLPTEDPGLSGLGAGRIGELTSPLSLSELVASMQAAVPYCRPRGVDAGNPIQSVAIACGSGGSLLSAALAKDCDLFVTGEATFHTCLEAEAANVSLLMVGHFASERFAMEHLATELQKSFGELNVWASRAEKDPVQSF